MEEVGVKLKQRPKDFIAPSSRIQKPLFKAVLENKS